jgi:hypothetical protein
MRPLTRIGAVLTALVMLGLLSAVPALAGNFAEVVMAPGAGDPPVAGEEHEIRFTLLQHGVTPVDHGPVQLIATLAGSGERIEVDATSLGDGEWVATVTLPRDGEWQIEVRHAVFATSPPTTLAVMSAGSAGGSIAPATLTAALAAVALLGLAIFVRRRRNDRPETAAALTRA